MTLGEIIEALNDLVASGVSEETEVRLATQPSYPFEYQISQITQVDGLGESDETVIYIAEGAGQSYLPGAVSEELGWK